jgi:RNA polymerase sigma-70 factor (sigma-E family)
VSADGRDTFTAWAAARRRALVRSAFLLTGDHGRAEDLVQQALMKVAERWNRLADGNPDAYARTIMYRDHVSWWRRHKHGGRGLDDAILSVREMPRDGRDLDQGLVLEQALSRLTPKQRAVLVLRFYEDMSERDTARALGVSPGTVKSQTSAALRNLRDNAPEVRVLLGMEAETGD